MKEEKTSSLLQRMIGDMKIRAMCEQTQQVYICCVKHFASFLGRSPNTATPEDLRAYQSQMTKDLVSPPRSMCTSFPCGSFSASPADARR
jgi:integrase/recombinase XerD